MSVPPVVQEFPPLDEMLVDDDDDVEDSDIEAGSWKLDHNDEVKDLDVEASTRNLNYKETETARKKKEALKCFTTLEHLIIVWFSVTGGVFVIVGNGLLKTGVMLLSVCFFYSVCVLTFTDRWNESKDAVKTYLRIAPYKAIATSVALTVTLVLMFSSFMYLV
jgi:hypothetical protein